MSILTRELSQDNHRRFVSRVIASETVWGIRVANGFAYAESNDVETSGTEATVVLLFWSDRAYAARAQRESYPQGVVESLTLFDFLFRWLPGMESDRVLAGTNWTGDLIGMELDPRELQGELLDTLGDVRVTEYIGRLKRAVLPSEE